MKFDKIHFGDWLRRWMEAQGHTSFWLAEQLGVAERTARTIWEQEEPPISRLRKLSQITGQDLFLLFVSVETREGLKAEKPYTMSKDDPRLRIRGLEKEMNELKMRVERLEVKGL